MNKAPVIDAFFFAQLPTLVHYCTTAHPPIPPSHVTMCRILKITYQGCKDKHGSTPVVIEREHKCSRRCPKPWPVEATNSKGNCPAHGSSGKWQARYCFMV